MEEKPQKLSPLKRNTIIAIASVAAIAIIVGIVLVVRAVTYNGIAAAGQECAQYTEKKIDGNTDYATSLEATEDGSGLEAIVRPHVDKHLSECIAEKTGMTDMTFQKIKYAGITEASQGSADWGKYHAEWQAQSMAGVDPYMQPPAKYTAVSLTIEKK